MRLSGHLNQICLPASPFSCQHQRTGRIGLVAIVNQFIQGAYTAFSFPLHESIKEPASHALRFATHSFRAFCIFFLMRINYFSEAKYFFCLVIAKGIVYLVNPDFFVKKQESLFRIFPVVPYVLDVVIVFKHVEHFLHILDIFLICERNGAVLREHFNLSGQQAVTL